jgi:hypothetical protein
MTDISFIDERNKERLYDSYMLRERLRMTKTTLQRELNRYNFTTDDYIIYKNQFLFYENSVVKFIESIVLRKYLLDKRKITNESLNHIRQSIKEFMRRQQ